MKRFICLHVLLFCSLSLPAAHSEGGLALFAVNVGKGDALLISSNGHSILVDTGYVWNMGGILEAMRYLNVDSLDAVFVTHTDKDHVGGLDWLSSSGIPIGAWYSSAEYADVSKESKHPAVKAAALRGENVQWLRSGSVVTIGDMRLDVLAPSVSSDNENDNSLVMMLSSPDGRILLAGDMEFGEEALLLADHPDLNCDVLKVPNHADNDAASEAFLTACAPEMAVISTSSLEKPETPDPRILAVLEMLGTKVFVTQQATGGICIKLHNGDPIAEAVNYADPPSGIAISEVHAEEDYIVVKNSSGTDLDLSGWYLISERGLEYWSFPAGSVLAAGASCTIGTRSTRFPTDYSWDDKNVVHKSKSDLIGLFFVNGLQVSVMSNGL